MPNPKKDLVQIIRDNPGCVATIDNDCWWLHTAPPKPVEDLTADEYDVWQDTGELANATDIEPIEGGGCYDGRDLLAALAVIVGIKIESV